MVSPKAQSGYVLVAVLAALVILSILAATLARISTASLAESHARLTRQQTHMAASDLEASVIYLMLSRRRTPAGLATGAPALVALPTDDSEPAAVEFRQNDLRLDGQPYDWRSEWRFWVLDDRGRMPVGAIDSPMGIAVLRELGGEPTEMASLVARLLDYQDPDDLARPGGAEARDYARTSLPPPSNRAMRSPLELRTVPGWNERLRHLEDFEVLELFTLERQYAVNLNTAPERLLRAIPGLGGDAMRRHMVRRSAIPLDNPESIASNLGISTGDDMGIAFSTVPARSGTLWVSRAGEGHALVIHFSTSPSNHGGRPWRIDFRHRIRTAPDSGDRPAVMAPEILAASAKTDPREW